MGRLMEDTRRNSVHFIMSYRFNGDNVPPMMMIFFYFPPHALIDMKSFTPQRFIAHFLRDSHPISCGPSTPRRRRRQRQEKAPPCCKWFPAGYNVYISRCILEKKEFPSCFLAPLW